MRSRCRFGMRSREQLARQLRDLGWEHLGRIEDSQHEMWIRPRRRWATPILVPIAEFINGATADAIVNMAAELAGKKAA